uniref:Outer membrane protein/protective antigen OMA87 n=1 Tax=uncultured bacterium pES01019D12 TaxID=355333 RepID=A0EJJ8_9BACT|nr:outer membrane protein/protective antigen OMA87 [uncultured bacterium pES01019D12]
MRGQSGIVFGDTLIDPEDGMLDVSSYLESAAGFLPIPIIITEPAVGFGLGLAAAYFHPPKELDREEHTHHGPPSISVGLAVKTDNGTYAYGGAHMGVWKDDHIRYTGAIAKLNVNMSFYLDDRNDAFSISEGIDFNLDGIFLFQQASFRLKESNWWVGANYIYFTATNTFDLGNVLPPEIPNPAFDLDLAGLGIMVQYDGRNSVFTPSSGLSAKFEYKNFADTWGGDFDYNDYKVSLFHYTPFSDYSSLGLRLQAQTVDGDAPFFAYPFVSLRGIPAMRYQGESVVTGEAEYLWGVTPRWSVVFFGGVGRTTSINRFKENGRTVGAGGMGFRYRLARKQKLQTGIDIARGPEDTSIYLTVGSAWAF